MEPICRAVIVYLFLMLLFRVSGKRTLAQTTNFDFILLLIISETTQQAMVGEDRSMTNAFLLIITLVGMSIVLSLLKQYSPALDRWMDGLPVILLENGHLHRHRMDKLRVNQEDILEAARTLCGLERLDQIKYAILERHGEISIVPHRNDSAAA